MTTGVYRIIFSIPSLTNSRSTFMTKISSSFFRNHSLNSASVNSFASHFATRPQNKFNKGETMPVITTLAVAAHRRHHHNNSSSHFHTSAPCSGGSVSLIRRQSQTQTTNITDGYSTGGMMDQQVTPNQPLGAFFRRFYAKGRDKQKSKKTTVVLNEAEMREVINLDAMKGQFNKTMEQMKEEFSSQLNIRGAAGALETLTVEFEGETYPLQELAQVGRKNPQLAVLNLSSLPDALQPVLKAIQESGMNLNPQQEGTTIYVPLPKVTREHREMLAKNAKGLFNKFKLELQAIQNKYVKQCKSQKELGEDLVFSVQQQVMKLTESYILDAENLLQVKQTELLDNK